MRTEVSKWGNSLAVRLPKAVAEELSLEEGTPVEIVAEDRTLVVRPLAPVLSIESLVAGITPENLPDESFDDRPRGAEQL